MKLLVMPLLLILLLAFYPSTNIRCQVNHADSVFYQAAVYNAISFYKQSTNKYPRYYNGRRYKPYRIGFIAGSPFFESDQFAEGNVVYEGGSYDNVNLLYDQVTDMLILKAGFVIELISERVSQFTIAGHTFTRLIDDSLNNLPATGYYENLYSGKIEILKKEQKKIKEDLSNTEGVRGEIISKKYYYLKKNGQYFFLKNKSVFLGLLKDRENEIQQFIKYHDLNFKKDKETAFTKIAGYYDQLTR